MIKFTDIQKIIKPYLIHILPIIGIILGGGAGIYSVDTEDQNINVRQHQGDQTANNSIDIEKLKQEIKRLQENHP